ncbi:MAG: plasmid pRiA4b ORF-3 family protein [Sedimentisphaerales bacterium]|nr:plasmid pRiA4b ORF-3 family protein [Sedimentisphaerales bacterium]
MPKKPSGSKSQSTQIYELKITLRGSKPPIWRRAAVPSDMSLGNLHYAVQIVMGWTNSHLHQFIASDLSRKEYRSLGKRGYTHNERCFSDPRFELEDTGNENKVTLNELAPAVKGKFIYEYDFGDGWEHLIEVVKISPPADKVKYPVCLAGELACPPEDCGGIWGYYDMLEVLKNPKHKDYKDIRGWMPPGFKPERFNLEAINAELATLRGCRARKPDNFI